MIDEHEQQLVRSPSVVKCDDCTFISRSDDKIQEHKKKHGKEIREIKEDKSEKTTFMHSCITCGFNTNDYQTLREHVDKIHRPPVIKVDEPSDEILNIEKDVKVKTVVEHTQTQTKQEENGSEKCKSCGKLFSSVLDLE